MDYVIIIISSIFVNNVVLAKFLGICPFMGVSNKVNTALGMSGAVAFVMVIATLVTFYIQKLLVSLGIDFMQTIAFILVIASLVQMVELVLKKVSPSLYQALGIFLPLITTNCTVLGVAIEVAGKATYGMKLTGTQFKFTNHKIDEFRPAPLLGADTGSVLSGLLGYSEEKIKELREKGAL